MEWSLLHQYGVQADSHLQTFWLYRSHFNPGESFSLEGLALGLASAVKVKQLIDLSLCLGITDLKGWFRVNEGNR